MTASSAHITWHEPKDNGSPILGYWVERKEENSKYWTRVNRALINSPEVKVRGLQEGLTYIFRVCAENLAGPGAFSEPSERTTALDAIRKFWNWIMQCLKAFSHPRNANTQRSGANIIRGCLIDCSSDFCRMWQKKQKASLNFHGSF